MATEARKLQVGIFVIAATVIAIATLVWLGATRLFERTTTLVTYFSESVQGLEPGAAVKYRGVPAGRVQTIGIAPDGKLIEVTMSMDDASAALVRRDQSLRAQLQLVGITGLRYVEIDRRTGVALEQSPPLDFKPRLPVVPSMRSSVTLVTTALQEIYDQVMSVDVKGISDDTRATLQSMSQFLHDPRLHTMLTNLAAASHTANEVAVNLRRVTAEIQVGPAMQNLTRASQNAEALFAQLRDGDIAGQLTQAATQINRLAETTQQFIIGLQHTVDRLDRTTGNLEQLTEDVARQPSRLLFSRPPAPGRSADEDPQ